MNVTKPLIIFCAVVVLAVSVVFSLMIGAASISAADVLGVLIASSDHEVGQLKERIILELRAPRAVLAFLAGAGLSIAGGALQTVTRNPLADPYLFGISSGASFGAVLVIASLLGLGGSYLEGDLTSTLAEMGVAVGAFIGSTISVVLVVTLAGRARQIEKMLLAGVATSFMFSAFTSLVLYVSDPLAASSLLFWTLGSFTAAQWSSLLLPAIVIVLCMFCFFASARSLSAVQAGDESAYSLGVQVKRLRLQMLLLSSLLTATLVAICGGIGFVGLMIPHITRRLVPARGPQFFVVTAFLGGIFMLWVDIIARSIVDGIELPVGIITAAIGSVFFLVLMQKRVQ